MQNCNGLVPAKLEAVWSIITTDITAKAHGARHVAITAVSSLSSMIEVEVVPQLMEVSARLLQAAVEQAKCDSLLARPPTTCPRQEASPGAHSGNHLQASLHSSVLLSAMSAPAGLLAIQDEC